MLIENKSRRWKLESGRSLGTREQVSLNELCSISLSAKRLSQKTISLSQKRTSVSKFRILDSGFLRTMKRDNFIFSEQFTDSSKLDITQSFMKCWDWLPKKYSLERVLNRKLKRAIHRKRCFIQYTEFYTGILVIESDKLQSQFPAAHLIQIGFFGCSKWNTFSNLSFIRFFRFCLFQFRETLLDWSQFKLMPFSGNRKSLFGEIQKFLSLHFPFLFRLIFRLWFFSLFFRFFVFLHNHSLWAIVSKWIERFEKKVQFETSSERCSKNKQKIKESTIYS